MTINVYDKGDLVRLPAEFRNLAAALADPTTVSFRWTTPAGVTAEYVYGTDAELVKDATGKYHVDLEAPEAGTWFYRWGGEGDVQAVEVGQFRVQASDFTVTPPEE